ncbi:MAG TPA: hypothetical protein VFV55_08775 [Usitatibacteraceae bacterium]|nr:hypothetical protein [Usitatibacteraceae bacterium]
MRVIDARAALMGSHRTGAGGESEEIPMDQEATKIYAKLAEFEKEIANLREGYLVVGKRYSESIESLKVLTDHAREAAERAAASAILSATAATNAATAAREAANETVVAAAAAASAAAAQQAEEVSVQASAHATLAAKRAAEAAAEAVRMAHAASEAAQSVKGKPPA